MTADSQINAMAEAIANAIAQSVTQALSAANAANAQAASTTGTTTGRTVSDEGVKTGFVAEQVDSDIGETEAWAANMKRTYDIHQTDERESFNRSRAWFDDIMGSLQKRRAELDALTNQLFQAGINSGHLQHLGAITDQNLGTDRKMNINETDLAAKSAAVLSDAMLAAVAKATGK